MHFNPLDPFGSLLDWMIAGAVDGWKQACKFALQAGSITGDQWQTVGDITGKLAGVMLYVVVITASVAIAREAFRGRVGGMFTVLCQAVFAWPLTLVTIYLLMMANSFASGLTGKILGVDLTKPDQQLNLPDINGDAIKGALSAPLVIIILLILLLGSASILLCMAARRYLIIIGVCLICTVWMIITWHGVWDQVKRYAGWLLGVILYQPICALLITITGELMKNAAGDNPLTFVTAVVGMAMASICPWVIILKIIHFLPHTVASGVTSAASAGQGTVDTTRKAVDTTRKAVEQVVATGTQIAGAAAGAAGLPGGAGAGAGASTAMTPKVAPSASAAAQGQESPSAATSAQGGAGSEGNSSSSSSSSSSSPSVGAASMPAAPTPVSSGSTGSPSSPLGSKVGVVLSAVSSGAANSRGMRAVINTVAQAVRDSRGGSSSERTPASSFGAATAPPAPSASGTPAAQGPGGINVAPPPVPAPAPQVNVHAGGQQPDVHINVAPPKGD